jgi:hypothetical protein
LGGPIYNCSATVGGAEKMIQIDVRKSAPHFEEPCVELAGVLRNILNDPVLQIKKVVEFGAGKFRNVSFILKQGKEVCAVEFENGRRSAGFQLMTPDEFSKTSQRFDLALLVNVVPVIPFSSERIEVIRTLHSKLNEGKYLLWFAQIEGHYRKLRESGENPCMDGIWLGNGRQFKTFYKYHSMCVVDSMMDSSGFSKVKRFSGLWNDAALYRRE